MVSIHPNSEENSAGKMPAGGDLESGQLKKQATGEPDLNGRLSVSVNVKDALTDKVCSSFKT